MHAVNFHSNKYQHLWLYFSLRNVPRICLKLCALFSNKYQHSLLYLSLENAPSISLELCANFSNKYQHLLLYLSLENAPSISLKLCANFSNKYQHLLLFLSLENMPSIKCLSQQYGPALMVSCCLGFRALDSSRNRALHASSTSLSSLQAAPWNSSLFKLFSLE